MAALPVPARRGARLVGAWVGDSRPYVVNRDGEVELLTDSSSKYRLGSGRVEPRPIHRPLGPGEVDLLLTGGPPSPGT